MTQNIQQYRNIRAILSQQITCGTFKSGAKLPSERQLSERFSTTRVTLREALSSLESDGLIYRENRRGWFVTPERVIYNPTINSHFHQMVSDQNKVPTTHLLCADLVPAPSRVQRLLGVPPQSMVYRLKRIRLVDNRSVLYVEHYIQPDYFPNLLQHDLSRSLSDVYAENYQIHYDTVRFDVYPVGLHEEASKYLKVTPRSYGLLINRVNYDQHHRLIDCDFEYWRHDSVVITATTTKTC